ncbi:MAG: class I SAM-dependent methyltransferase [Deltaproteobacteria bacterium]
MSEEAFPHLDRLRQAYDRDAGRRHQLEDLQWRLGVLDRWLSELPSAPRLLELGAGTGQLALHAQARGASVQAVDLSPQNVARCRERGIEAQVGNFRALDALDALGLFDGVYSINALLHVPRAEHAGVLSAVCRRLVPGGSLLLVNWGGQDSEGLYEADSCHPPRFFSLYDDARFNALEFEGFEATRRELLKEHAADGLHPQLLVLRRQGA